MLPIAALPSLLPNQLRGLLFDLDDTLLDHSQLTEGAYSALFRLREAGFECYAVTGRPAGWAAVIVNQWPIQGAIAENGALAFFRDDGGLCTQDPVAPAERLRRKQALAALWSFATSRGVRLRILPASSRFCRCFLIFSALIPGGNRLIA